MTKSQHYVPIFYLKNFADSSGKLFVYDRAADKMFSCLPKNICKSNFLYETPWKETKIDCGKYVLCNSIEKSFCEYEGRYSALLKRLLGICTEYQSQNTYICSPKDKKELVSLIANLFVRNPWVMEYFGINTIPKELDRHPVSNVIRKLMEELDWGGADSLIKYSVKNAYLLEHDEGGLVYDLKEEIEKLNFTFYYSKSGKFITSSCPSCISYIKNGQFFAYLPLSPFVAVYFGKDTIPKAVNNQMKIISSDHAMDINHIYLSFNTEQVKYIISNSDSTLQEYLS